MDDKPGSTNKRSWMSMAQASSILGLREVTLRRTIERHARRRPDGSVAACVDGIHARKFQRQWRVALDRRWLDPIGAEKEATNA